MGYITNNKGVKNQVNCYRNIKGKKYSNFCDLIYTDEENKKAITEAKSQYKNVKILFRSREISADGSVFILKAVFVNNDEN